MDDTIRVYHTYICNCEEDIVVSANRLRWSIIGIDRVLNRAGEDIEHKIIEGVKEDRVVV